MPDGGDAVWQGNVGQAGAALKRTVTNSGNAVWQGDAGQAGAAIKRPFPDVNDVVS